TLMAPGRGCLVLAILLAMVDIRLGEAGNYTVKGLKQRRHLEFTHSQGTPSSGFLQKVWVMLATSLLALQAL
uniref:CD160 molecule n=2 Tax=Felinae TaxID=338152 RepID=A0ABI7ZL28_FELCA